MIKVLIVDDSRVAQEFLAYILASDPAIQVVGAANNGAEALDAALEKHPDIITMDIHMPKIDGYEATRAIMENAPTPIVIVSASTSIKGMTSTFRALEAGALAVVLRPPGIGHPGYAAAAQELIQMVKIMSEIKVVRRFPRPPKEPDLMPPLAPVLTAAKEIQLVAIGASTGGPPALNKILSLLPQALPVPVLIVQHIAPGFVAGFVEWLTSSSHFPLHMAEHGLQPLPGHGYVAPDGFHMGVGSDLRLVLSNQPSENGLRPSVTHLFCSVAQALGPQAVGVLLTGMGRDGVEGLKMLKDKGAITIAQDEASSVVHGMPGEAIKLGAAMYILAPEAIAGMLTNLVKRPNGGNV